MNKDKEILKYLSVFTSWASLNYIIKLKIVILKLNLLKKLNHNNVLHLKSVDIK